MHRNLGLDGRLLARCHRVLARALEGHTYLTRKELATRIESARIKAAGQRLAYILMHAEFEALICSGPRKGKQFTYALLEERVPPCAPWTPEETLKRWTHRYFRSHGPAQPKDFAWWSGLTMEDARLGLEMLEGELESQTVDGKRHWQSPQGAGRAQAGSARALLLSIYDEYTIAYRDRSALGAEPHVERLIQMGNALTSVLILDGGIAGTWKRTVRKGQVDVVVTPFRALGNTEKEAVAKAANGYADFHELPLDLRFARHG